MIVYGASLSPFVRKVLAFAAEKGVPVELKQIGLGSPDPDFLSASPFRKMPAFRDGDFTLADSSAIVTYIEALHPEPALIPAEPRARGRTIWFEEFADTILAPVVGKLFFNRVVAALIGREGDLAAADRAEAEELPPVLDYLETQVPDGLHLVGGALTLADIAVATAFVNLGHAGFTPDEARHPKVAAFVRAVLERPSFAALVEKERLFLAR